MTSVATTGIKEGATSIQDYRWKSLQSLVTMISRRFRIVAIRSTVVSYPSYYLNEISHKTRHKTLQYSSISLQHELVYDPALIELLDHCEQKEKAMSFGSSSLLDMQPQFATFSIWKVTFG